MRFRHTPRQAEILLQQIGDKLNNVVSTNHALTTNQKLELTLRYFASNDFYYSIQDSQGSVFLYLKNSFVFLNQGPSRTTVMRIIKKTTRIINQTFAPQIAWPTTENECRICKYGKTLWHAISLWSSR